MFIVHIHDYTQRRIRMAGKGVRRGGKTREKGGGNSVCRGSIERKSKSESQSGRERERGEREKKKEGRRRRDRERES